MTGQLVAGRYRLAERLGAGGMSEVWAADDTELDRRVALKLLAPQADTERFRREARAVAALGHPNINQVYDYGEADGRPYMALECLTGGSLEDRLSGGAPLPDEDTRRIAVDVAGGLAHAHARGLVHRDLKPANVLFDSEGRAKIADFGIARLGEDGTLTEAGTVIGTASTISPEQAAGHPALPASDVYSFGVLLFWMLTGRPPFLSDRPLELLHLHRDATPPDLGSVRADAPADLAALATAALAKDPSARPADGEELLRHLGPASAASPPPAPRRPTSPRRRRRAGLVAFGTLVAGLAAAGTAVAIAVAHDDGTRDVSTSAPVRSLELPKVSTAHSASARPAPPPPASVSTHETTAKATTSPAAPATRALPTTAAVTTIPSPPATPEAPLTTETYDLTTTTADVPEPTTITAPPG